MFKKKQTYKGKVKELKKKLNDAGYDNLNVREKFLLLVIEANSIQELLLLVKEVKEIEKSCGGIVRVL